MVQILEGGGDDDGSFSGKVGRKVLGHVKPTPFLGVLELATSWSMGEVLGVNGSKL